MRTALTIICYGLALGLGLLAIGLAGYGFLQDRSVMTATETGFGAVGVLINGVRYISTGAVVGVLALACAVAGGLARA